MSEFSQPSYAQTAPPAHSVGAPQGGAAPAAPSKKPAILGVVGALVALVGSVTIWTVVDAGAMGEDRYPGRDGDGVIALITALVAAGLYVGAMVTRKAVLHAVGGVFSLITLVVAVLNLADPERLAKQVAKDESGASDKMIEQALKTVDVSSGPGIYITLAGALMALVFGVIGFMKARAAR